MVPEELKQAFVYGIELSGEIFRPFFYLTRVDEPEFGCEGRPEEGMILGAAYGYDANGPRTWQLEETAVWVSGIDDGTWVGTWNEKKAILKKGKTQPMQLSDELYRRLFEE